jgi:hypothetical protein
MVGRVAPRAPWEFVNKRPLLLIKPSAHGVTRLPLP